MSNQELFSQGGGGLAFRDEIAHTLGKRYDSSEDGTGRGLPLVASGINGGDIGYSLRANPSHSGDKGDGGVNTTLVMAHGQGNAEVVRDGSPSLTCNHEAPIMVHGTQDPSEPEVAFAQGRNSGQENVVALQDIRGMDKNQNGKGYNDDGSAYTVDAMATQGIATPMSARRLVPRECERLQGFFDDFTLVPFRKQPAADGPRYKALGNTMAVPVLKWIGQRIETVNNL